MLSSYNLTLFTSALFYGGDTCDRPALMSFTKLPTLATSYGQTTLVAYVASTDALIGNGTRQEFQVVSSFVSYLTIQKIHDTFTSMVLSEIWDIAGLQASVAFQPVTKNFTQRGIDKGGNPQGVDIDKAPYFWMVENFSWTDAKDDDRIYDFCAKVIAAINVELTAIDQKAHYLYMNDAGRGQPIFQNYKASNLERLRRIRAKYDPENVYTDLEKGGWKLPAHFKE